jgi:hypothetical protein
VLAACGEEAPPRSVSEFMEDPILLEATMVRCGQDRAASRYDAECINASNAVDRLAAAREQARRQEFEAESERKRQALRGAQQAAADARRRAQEAAKRREEAAKFGDFEPLPPEEEDAAQEQEIPPASDDAAENRTPQGAAAAPLPAPGSETQAPQDNGGPALPGAGSGAAGGPVETLQPADSLPADAAGTELDAVREELKRRQDEGRE